MCSRVGKVFIGTQGASVVRGQQEQTQFYWSESCWCLITSPNYPGNCFSPVLIRVAAFTSEEQSAFFVIIEIICHKKFWLNVTWTNGEIKNLLALVTTICVKKNLVYKWLQIDQLSVYLFRDQLTRGLGYCYLVRL